MGFNDRIDFPLSDEIQDLIDEGLLQADSAAFGLAQQVIGQGYDSLTPKQRAVYNRLVSPVLAKRRKELEWRRRMGNPDH